MTCSVTKEASQFKENFRVILDQPYTTSATQNDLKQKKLEHYAKLDLKQPTKISWIVLTGTIVIKNPLNEKKKFLREFDSHW